MTSMYTPAGHTTVFHRFAIVARPVELNGVVTSREVPPGREHVLDHSELTDLVVEALAEAKRLHGARDDTLWGDAAEAAALILRHVAEVCGVEPERSDSESKFLGGGGVSSDHA
jgi:hypothetical protein